MEFNDLNELARLYDLALTQELAKKRRLAMCEAEVLAATACAHCGAQDAGLINGKNADARKSQLAVVLQVDKGVLSAEADARAAKQAADEFYATRMMIEAKISLTKAWLYSQARIG